MRLLIGADGGDGGWDALALARGLAAGEETSAVLASVVHSGALPLDYVELPAAEAGEAGAMLERARERLPGIEVQTRAYAGGSPASVLTTVAERERVDAIVIGSPHRGAIGRVMIGSVALGLLNGAPADVAVAPRGYAEREQQQPPLRRIVVGYDGSPEAKAALARAEALARRSRARIELVTVVKPPAAATPFAPGVYAAETPADPDRTLAAGVDSIDSSLAAAAVRLDGDPAGELLRHCEDEVDLLVVGSRGYGPLTRVLLGSVSRRLVEKSSCPVLVARRP